MATAEMGVDIREMGLGGATVMITFVDQIELAYGVGILLGCDHGHNFAIVLDRPTPGIVTSEHGMACINMKLSQFLLRDPDQLTSFTVPPPPPPKIPF